MKKTFAVRLPEEQRKELEKIATDEDRSVGAVIRRMIAESINRRNSHKKKHRGLQK